MMNLLQLQEINPSLVKMPALLNIDTYMCPSFHCTTYYHRYLNRPGSREHYYMTVRKSANIGVCDCNDRM